MKKSQKHSKNMLEGFNSLSETHGLFGKMDIISQKELFEISKDIFKMTEEINNKFRKMKQKTTEIIALEASLVAVEVASLGAMTGKKRSIMAKFQCILRRTIWSSNSSSNNSSIYSNFSCQRIFGGRFEKIN